jgi:hypothetical protein
MRQISTVLLLLAVMGYFVPKSNSQSRATPAQERKEHQHKAAADVQPEMLRARQSLQAGKDELVHSGGEWGGHREAAIQHVDAALAEIAKAEQWARQHKDIK